MIQERVIQTFFFFLILTALLLTWSLQTVARANAVVELVPASRVAGQEVLLRDISWIQGASKPQRELLGSVVLGRAPAPAQSYQLRRSYVIAKMKQNLIDMNAVTVLGPEVIEVRSEGSILPGRRLVELAQKQALEETGWAKGEVRFEMPKSPRDLSLPPGKVEVEVWKVSGDFYGLTHFRSEIRVNGEPVASVPLVMYIHRYVPVVVAEAELERGAVLTEEAIGVRQRDLSRESLQARRKYCNSEEPLVGKRLKTFVRAGRVLTYDMLADPPVVERGEHVAIEVHRGDVSVSAQGEARASAAVGESVPVRNLANGKTIMARVIRPGAVVVE